MNELQFGNKARHLLNQGLALKPETEQRLRAARELALSRKREAPATAFAWAGGALGRIGWTTAVVLLLPLVVLVAGAFAFQAWQQNQRIAEIEEVDALLLADDLPIDAYLDRGFQNWLKKTNAVK